MMKQLLSLVLVTFGLLVSTGLQAQSSIDCNKTCEINEEKGEGVFLGVRIQDMKNDRDGIFIVKVIEGTAAERMGIERADIVLDINGTPMTAVKQMQDYVKSKHEGYAIEVNLIRRGKQTTLKGEFGFETVEVVTTTICCDENIGQLQVNDFKIYPNPSKGIFNVSFDVEQPEPVNMRIIDLSGRVVFQQEFGSGQHAVNQQVNIERGRAAGEHVILIEQGGKVYRDKVVVVD